MQTINELIRTIEPKSVGIAGHVSPDGDCIGSCTALFQYLKRAFPEIPEVALYLEEPKDELKGIPFYEAAFHEDNGKTFDLFITCDVSERARIAVAGALFDRARTTACIDHHVTNPGFAAFNHVEPHASSCAEVLWGLFERRYVDRDIAASLYTGIVHDTGVLQYPNTSARTLRAAADLLEYGIDFNGIIDRSFNSRTYTQSRILGYALQKASLYHDGQTIAVSVSLAEMADFGAVRKDLDMIVSQLRYVEGVEAAVFAYEIEDGKWKVSTRSNRRLDMAAVCALFGGGGHVKAAGCSLEGTTEDVLERVLLAVEEALAC